MSGVPALVHGLPAHGDCEGESRERSIGARGAIEIREERLGFDFELPGLCQLHRDGVFGIGRQPYHIAVGSGDGHGVRRWFERRTIDEIGGRRSDRGGWITMTVKTQYIYVVNIDEMEARIRRLVAR